MASASMYSAQGTRRASRDAVEATPYAGRRMRFRGEAGPTMLEGSQDDVRCRLCARCLGRVLVTMSDPSSIVAIAAETTSGGAPRESSDTARRIFPSRRARKQGEREAKCLAPETGVPDHVSFRGSLFCPSLFFPLVSFSFSAFFVFFATPLCVRPFDFLPGDDCPCAAKVVKRRGVRCGGGATETRDVAVHHSVVVKQVDRHARKARTCCRVCVDDTATTTPFFFLFFMIWKTGKERFVVAAADRYVVRSFFFFSLSASRSDLVAQKPFCKTHTKAAESFSLGRDTSPDTRTSRRVEGIQIPSSAGRRRLELTTMGLEPMASRQKEEKSTYAIRPYTIGSCFFNVLSSTNRTSVGLRLDGNVV